MPIAFSIIARIEMELFSQPCSFSKPARILLSFCTSSAVVVFDKRMPSGCEGNTISRSPSASPEEKGLMRTNRSDPIKSSSARDLATISRAVFLQDIETESSRSRTTESTANLAAFLILYSSSPGMYNKARRARIGSS
jgi:hypothetical protein